MGNAPCAIVSAEMREFRLGSDLGGDLSRQFSLAHSVPGLLSIQSTYLDEMRPSATPYICTATTT